MSEHTKLPWKLIPQSGAGPMVAHEYDTGKQMNPTALRLVCHMLQRGNSLEQDKANADLIVRAVNSHADLLAALQDSYAVLADIKNNWPNRHTQEGQALLCKMRDALCLATGRDAQDVQDEYTNKLAAQ